MHLQPGIDVTVPCLATYPTVKTVSGLPEWDALLLDEETPSPKKEAQCETHGLASLKPRWAIQIEMPFIGQSIGIEQYPERSWQS